MNIINQLQEKQQMLGLAMKTWVRDSHGLYDYESTQVKPTNAIVADKGIIVRKKSEIRSVNSLLEIEDDEFLMSIKYDKGNSFAYIYIY